MSKPTDYSELFPRDASGEFGKDEGVTGYAHLALQYPYKTVGKLAERAVRLQMIVEGRFDVDPKVATQAVVDELFPEVDFEN